MYGLFPPPQNKMKKKKIVINIAFPIFLNKITSLLFFLKFIINFYKILFKLFDFLYFQQGNQSKLSKE